MNILNKIRKIRKSLLFENNEIPASARKKKSPSKQRKTADRSYLVKKQITRKDGRIMNYWVNPNKDKPKSQSPKQSKQVVTPDLFTAAAERIKEVAAAVNKIKSAGYEIGQEVSHTLQNGKVLKGKVAIKDRQAAIELDKPHNDQTHSQFNNKWEKTETETKKKAEISAAADRLKEKINENKVNKPLFEKVESIRKKGFRRNSPYIIIDKNGFEFEVDADRVDIPNKQINQLGILARDQKLKMKKHLEETKNKEVGDWFNTPNLKDWRSKLKEIYPSDKDKDDSDLNKKYFERTPYFKYVWSYDARENDKAKKIREEMEDAGFKNEIGFDYFSFNPSKTKQAIKQKEKTEAETRKIREEDSKRKNREYWNEWKIKNKEKQKRFSLTNILSTLTPVEAAKDLDYRGNILKKFTPSEKFNEIWAEDREEVEEKGFRKRGNLVYFSQDYIGENTTWDEEKQTKMLMASKAHNLENPRKRKR